MKTAIASEPLGLGFVPRDVLEVMERLRRAGFDAWLVGGALRDHFLGLEPKDWDLATSAAPGQVRKIFPKVVPVGIRHGTVQVHTPGREIETTSTEAAGTPGIMKDLGRRDFTMNALAVSFPDGMLLDPHSGRGDLKEKLIRAVGDAGERFREDPLRIVRAARLVSAYSFRVHPETFSAMGRESARLDQVAGERIRDEMLKLIRGRDMAVAFGLLRDSGAMDTILPELSSIPAAKFGDEFAAGLFLKSIRAVGHSPEKPRVRLAALFHALASSPGAGAGPLSEELEKSEEFDKQAVESAELASGAMRRWRMSNKDVEQVSRLVRNQIPPGAHAWSDLEIRRFIVRAGADFLEDLAGLSAAMAYAQEDQIGLDSLRGRINSQLAKLTALGTADLAVSGREVMEALGIGQGPLVGEILRRLLDAVVEEPPLNENHKLMNLVRLKYQKQ